MTNKNTLPKLIFLSFISLFGVIALLGIYSIFNLPIIITVVFILTLALASFLLYLILQLQDILDRDTKDIQRQNHELQETKNKLTSILKELEKEKHVTEEQKNELLRLELAIENASDPIIITDTDANIIYANKAVEYITGFLKNEIIGNKPSLWGKQMDKDYFENMWYTIKTKRNNFHGIITNKRKNGQKYKAEVHIAPVLNDREELLYFVGIERDVTQLKEADRMKTEFISLASHQLRTPLSTIKWYLEMLMNGDAGKLNKEQNDFISYMNRANERMIELVNSLLNVSRIESGRLIVEPSPTDIIQIIEEIVSDMQKKIKEKSIEINMDIKPEVPKLINLDQKMIRQVLSNLISNSVKYTHDYGKINISIYTENDQLVIKIEDNGYGIPEKDKLKLFSKFHRGENIAKLDNDGTGLGLYLVKSIMDASEGKIWFQSQENIGTAFWVSLPLSGVKAKVGEVSLDS